jgi:hypothetical protein
MTAVAALMANVEIVVPVSGSYRRNSNASNASLIPATIAARSVQNHWDRLQSRMAGRSEAGLIRLVTGDDPDPRRLSTSLKSRARA